jgi:hypothetical protein
VLPEATAQLWRRYVASERGHVRPESTNALEVFITALHQLDETAWHAWARDFAAQVAESRTPLPVPVRWPLFQRVLLPALTTAVANRTPGAARTLAFFGVLLAQTPGSPSPHHLLREALCVDSADELARGRLIELMREAFEYCLHELPAGVLWDADSASASQCDELLADVREVRELMMGREEAWLDRAEFHFREYRHWLQSDRSAGSYERFLTRL